MCQLEAQSVPSPSPCIIQGFFFLVPADNLVGVKLAQSLWDILQPSSPFLPSKVNLMAYVSKVWARFRRDGAVEEAERASTGFIWPDDVATRDMEALHCAGSLHSLIAKRHHESSEDRFNPTRCFTVFSGDPEWDTLLSIASSGAVIDTDPEFSPSPRPEPFRKLHSRLPNVMKSHAHKLWTKSQGLILPTAVASSLPGVHFNPTHWTPKPDEPLGRFLIDCSNCEEGCSLNSPVAKALVVTRYGKLSLPIIPDIITSWYRSSLTQHRPLASFRLWKDDVKSAFAQFNFDPSSASLLAVAIDNHLSFIYTVGCFGWTGSPMVWGVLSRALLRACSVNSNDCLDLYVDDFVGLSPSETAAQSQLSTQNVVRQALGPTAISLQKSQPPCLSTDVLGWSVDLTTETIAPNSKGFDKLFFSFFAHDISQPLPLSVFQVLASLAERYSWGITGMRMFVAPLHHMVAKFTSHPNHHYTATSAVRLSVVMWRFTLFWLWANPAALRVPMRTMADPSLWQPDYILITDASPFKVGVVIRDPPGNLVAFASFPIPFPDARAQWQNLREYLGSVMGLLLLHQLHPHHPLTVKWVGDNVTALSSAEKHKCKSRQGQFACILSTLLQLMSRITITSVSHIPGLSMGDVDNLSRDRPTPSLSSSALYQFSHSDQISQLLLLCNPNTHTDCLDHLVVCSQINSLLMSILQPPVSV